LAPGEVVIRGIGMTSSRATVSPAETAGRVIPPALNIQTERSICF